MKRWSAPGGADGAARASALAALTRLRLAVGLPGGAPDELDEGGIRERLANAPVDERCPRLHLPNSRVAGHYRETPDGGVGPLDLRDELDAARPGHSHVGQKDVDPFEQEHRFRRRVRGPNVDAVPPEDSRDRARHLDLVIDDENSRHQSPRCASPSTCPQGSYSPGLHRTPEVDRFPVSTVHLRPNCFVCVAFSELHERFPRSIMEAQVTARTGQHSMRLKILGLAPFLPSARVTAP